MRRALPLLALLALSACVAETIERRAPRKGPVKEVGYVEFGGGHVRYSSEGWSWFVASRRKLALNLMRRNCGRDLDPKITDEYTRQDADASYNGVDIDSSMSIGDKHYVIENYVHLSYECVARGAAAETTVSTTTVHASSATLVVPEVSASSAAVAVSSAPPAVPASSSTLVIPEIPK
jgi:hypothetical protein